MASRDRTARKSQEVTAFPPLPRPPKTPRLPVDPRQSSSAHVIGAVAGPARGEMQVSGPNLSTGFYASAVDIGRLQAALERGLARFDDSQLETRWDEIFDWIRRVARMWVQRCKRMRIERRQVGIRIELETQDDLGYYEYGFDVFPRRGTSRNE
jgi:hypothetical protein